MAHDGKVETKLEHGYQPYEFDVICKRDRETIDHAGNRRFLALVEMRVERYEMASSRREKSLIIKEIIDDIQSNGGKFIRQEDALDAKASAYSSFPQPGKQPITPVFFAIGNKRAADKVGHAMRLALSKLESKRRRRESWPSRNSTPQQKAKRRATLQTSNIRVEPQPAHCYGLHGAGRTMSLAELMYTGVIGRTDGISIGNCFPVSMQSPQSCMWQSLHDEMLWNTAPQEDLRWQGYAEKLCNNEISAPNDDVSLASLTSGPMNCGIDELDGVKDGSSGAILNTGNVEIEESDLFGWQNEHWRALTQHPSYYTHGGVGPVIHGYDDTDTAWVESLF